MKHWWISYWKRRSNTLLFLLGAAALVLSALLGVAWGSSSFGFSALFDLSAGRWDSGEVRILLYLRLPRTLAALLCGGALSLSGAVIQGVLCNPLASPSIVGVNAGAGLAVTLGAALGLYGGWQSALFAFGGAFLAVTAVSVGARRWGASRSGVILMGVAVNSLLGALSDTLIHFLPQLGLMSRDFKVGDLSGVTYARLWPAALLALVGAVLLFTLKNPWELFSLGEDNARGLGMDSSRMRVILLLLAALLAGCAVSLAGLLSFVGLLVPHAVGRLTVTRSGGYLGLCALWGSAFVCLCDTVARSLFSPYELPVGILMAFLGAPFFLYVLLRRREQEHA